MSSRYIFNTAGKFVGFLSDDNLFDPSGEWLGFIRQGNQLYDPSGYFSGYLLGDDRVARLDVEPTKPRLPIPPRPMTPIVPLAPLERLPMVPLLPPWRDVFEHARAGQSRQRAFPQSGGFFPPLGRMLNDVLGAQIVASDGTFLGLVSRDRIDPNSILNEQGPYGSSIYPNSIFNPYGTYGSRYAALSPFNEFSPSPPKIVKNGAQMGSLSANQYIMGAIHPDELLRWLRGQST